MLRHVALFRWNDGTAQEDVRALADELRRLPDVIPEVRSLSVGPDVGITDGAHDFALVADFDGVRGYRTYANHPTHLDVIARLVRPIAADVTRVQYEVG